VTQGLSNTNSNPPQVTPELTGETLGDYVILRSLGSGGMAHVYLAEQVSLKRKVALKVMKNEYAGDATYVARFIREAQSAAALVQANIVQIYEVGQQDDKHFISQEYIAGKNLKQYLNRHGAVEAVMAVNILRQVGLALQKAAEHGVIHRDIKPENIMLCPNGEVKVTDFGLARVATNSGNLELTQIGIAMGTPLYMSPEQIEGREVDHRSDLYSLGVTAFNMLAGRPPFEGETALAVALQHVNNPPPELTQLRPDLPIELCDLVLRLMAKSPADRPATARDFLRELRKIQVDDHGDWESLALKLAETSQSFSGAPTEGRLAVTRQLQTLLRPSNRRPPIPWRTLATGLIAVVLSLSVGFVAARMQPVPDPFAKRETVAKKPTVEDQFRAALWSAQPEDEYRAVLKFFPASSEDYRTKQYRWKAMENLGILLLKKGDLKSLQEAEQYFQELAGPELSTFPQFQVSGWAGLACTFDDLYGQTGNPQYRFQVLEMLEHLDAPSYFNLLNRFMMERVTELMVKYNSGNTPTQALQPTSWRKLSSI
jgi:serine/threonine-protein kinase